MFDFVEVDRINLFSKEFRHFHKKGKHKKHSMKLPKNNYRMNQKNEESKVVRWSKDDNYSSCSKRR